MRPQLAAILLILGTVSTASASGSVTDLGKPTNTLPAPPAPLLDGFARKGPVLTQARKPEMLFIGTEVSGVGSGGGSAVELWALVKALDQFGRFSGVGTAETRNCDGTSATTSQCFSNDKWPGYATFNLDHARYTSRYLSFVHKDLIDRDLHVQTNFSSVESSLIQQYLRRYVTAPSSGWADFAWQESLVPPENHGLPLVSIGGYLRATYGVAISGDLTPNTSVIPLSFSTVQTSLQRGKAAGGATYSLVPDVNAEANVLTALICHADGKQPSSVCNRSVIKTVLKHVK
jgi:hypothetical protein